MNEMLEHRLPSECCAKIIPQYFQLTDLKWQQRNPPSILSEILTLFQVIDLCWSSANVCVLVLC